MNAKKPMTRQIMPRLAHALFALLLVSVATEAAPYPSSDAILGIAWHWDTRDRRAPGSDNWPVTWSGYNMQYASWGDGGGFGGTNTSGRVSLGVGLLIGPNPPIAMVNVFGGVDATSPSDIDGKSYGMLALSDTLLMWVSPGSGARNFEEARLHWSTDGGKSWAAAEWAFDASDGVALPAILNFGRSYLDARDDYVYHYFIGIRDASELSVQKPGKVFLARVPRSRVLDRTAYEFFSGNTPGIPAWTSDIAQRRPVFFNIDGIGWNLSVSHNAGLGRYILVTEHDESFRSNLGFYESTEPWGPWQTIEYYTGWGDGSGIDGIDRAFYGNFSNAWASTDGKQGVFVFSGIEACDALNTVRCTFITPGNTTLPTDQRASFLLDRADTRVMNILSRNASRSDFETVVDRCIANGDNTIYLFLSNQGDGYPRPTSFYRDDVFGGEIDLARVMEMRYRLDYVRQRGLAVVAWLFADDSRSISGASLDMKKVYVRNAVRLFDDQIAGYVIALEGDEHMRGDIAPLAAWLDGLTTKSIGNHQLQQRYDLSVSIPQVDLHYHQYGFGKSVAQIREATIAVAAALGKPLIACEYSLDSDSPTAWALGDAAIAAGAVGTGNGRTPAPVGVVVSEPPSYRLTVSPNPFNPTTTIRFSLAGDGPVSLRIYNAMGQQVRTLVNAQTRAGSHAVTWNGRDDRGRDVASGVYLCQLIAGNDVMIRRMVLVR
jgi:hypothetical protein